MLIILPERVSASGRKTARVHRKTLFRSMASIYPFLVGHLHRQLVACDTGIVDENIYFTIGGDGGLHHF